MINYPRAVTEVYEELPLRRYKRRLLKAYHVRKLFPVRRRLVRVSPSKIGLELLATN